MIRPGPILLLLFTACSSDLGADVGRSADFAPPTTVTVTAGPSSDSMPRPQVNIRTTTATVPWASVRLDDEKPLAEAAIPVRIEIIAIDLEAPILPLGVASGTGQMEVPENVDDVGWYRHGSAPGGPGSAVLAAHVDLAGEGPGVFFHLDRLKAGDRINVDFDDGTTSTFVVSLAERVPKGELNLASVFSPVGQPLVRLVTCGGDFNRTTRSYEDNLVVTAQPLRP